MSVWTVSGPSENYDAEQAERVGWFNKIVPKGNWKGAIDCWINAKDYEDCNNAAMWFTGGSLTVIGTSFTKVHVVSGGYYENVGA